jgi:hypothetical protein
LKDRDQVGKKGGNMTESTDVAAEFRRRDQRARRALMIGAATFFLVLAGSYLVSRLTLSSWGPIVGISNILLIVLSPAALGTGVANLSTSDKLAPRILYGIVTGTIAFVALVILAFQAYAAGGGKLHI